MTPSESAQHLGVEFAAVLANRPASPEFTEKIPISFAREHTLIGLASQTDRISVAISSLSGFDSLQIVSRFLGKPVDPLFAPASEIQSAINTAYQQRTGQAQILLDQIDRTQILSEIENLSTREDLLDTTSRAPVIKLVNLILFEAVQSRASDIHIQPYETTVTVRLRIDGLLYDSFTIPKSLQDESISRVKVMARMNIAEKRLPQDGRATVELGDRRVDLRIATLPTSFGERVVIRLLDKSARHYRLDDLGMDPESERHFRDLISIDHGIILVTGPTGSGKTTTLYSALQELKRNELNILTLEDPIEYRLEGISQTQVSEKKGMTFASGLRSVLRQDPDIIMVGEIRDHETAVMAIQSALTGHLVFSTLHTNDAASSITRLLDLGIEPYLLASSLVGVLAQRLVRRICPNCKAPADPSDLQRLSPSPSKAEGRGEGRTSDDLTIFKGAGCPLCRNSGYSNRVGLFELLIINDAIRQQIQSKSTASDIKSSAIDSGMRTLRDDGVKKILDGITTVDEVVRVTMRAST
jgi:general secretion pathway protein E